MSRRFFRGDAKHRFRRIGGGIMESFTKRDGKIVSSGSKALLHFYLSSPWANCVTVHIEKDKKKDSIFSAGFAGSGKIFVERFSFDTMIGRHGLELVINDLDLDIRRRVMVLPNARYARPFQLHPNQVSVSHDMIGVNGGHVYLSKISTTRRSKEGEIVQRPYIVLAMSKLEENSYSNLITIHVSGIRAISSRVEIS